MEHAGCDHKHMWEVGLHRDGLHGCEEEARWVGSMGSERDGKRKAGEQFTASRELVNSCG